MLVRRALLATPALALPAAAQEAWPNRPVTLLVPWAPGGSNDVLARLLSPALEARFRQPFVVENRPGGGGSVGMGLAMRARPDGLTVFVSSASNHVFHPLVANDASHDVRQAFHGVAMLVDVPNVLAVHPSVPARTIPELIAWIRTQRGGVSFGSSGVGSSNHLAGELFRMRTGLDMTHVPYRGGGPALSDLVAGTIPLAVMNLPTLIPPADGGRIRMIAVATAERVSLRPDLPTVQEGGVPDYAVRSWTGAFVPRGTPRAIIDTLATAFREILDQPAIRPRLRDLGSEPIFMDPDRTDAFVREEYDRWGPVVRAANVRLE
jgi:tripartite-type tricarboxylate transporter receptor subunit TctC